MKAKAASVCSVFGGCDFEIIIARIVQHGIVMGYGVKPVGRVTPHSLRPADAVISSGKAMVKQQSN